MATSGAIAAPLPTAHSTSDPSRWSALPVLLAGAFMVVLYFFIVNVALPAIATDLGASQSSLEWVIAGYGLAFRGLPDHGRAARRPVTAAGSSTWSGSALFTLHLACLRTGAELRRRWWIARVAQGARAAYPDAAGAVDDRSSPTRGDDHAPGAGRSTAGGSASVPSAGS